MKQVIVDQVESMERPLAHLLPEMTANVLGPVCILVYLFVLDWRMALLSLVSIPVGMAFMMAVMAGYGKQYEGSVRTTQAMNSAIVEYIGGIEVIKAFNQGKQSYARFSDSVKANASYYGASIRSMAYPLYLVGRVAMGNGSAIAIVSAVVLGLFALVWYLITRSFLKLATSTGAVAKVEYREKAARPQSIDRALLGRELSRFTASANYMLNCGMGILGLVIGAAALVWKGGSLLPMLEPVFAGRPGALSVLLCAALCTLVGMNDMAAPSVSLEGKSLWLAQSLPVTSWQVLRAKLRMHLLLTAVPAALCGICVAVVSPAGAAQTALALVVAALFTVLSALLCLFLGLKMPNLHWTSEITPIKQGGAVALALLSGVVYAALLAAGFFLIGWRMGYMAFMAAFAVVTLAACVLLLRWIKTKGCTVFANL